MIFKLLTEHNLEFLGLKGGCRGSSESTHVKMPHCWKSHALAHYVPIQDTVAYEQKTCLFVSTIHNPNKVGDDAVQKLDQLSFARPLTSQTMLTVSKYAI